ncbi:hypothetical protein RHGRI_013456 [Rhododendron griersonianum]|uniref:Amidase domain-containing protein n=1 Tax=Rhododendron griersonianum TaxID=479676 RepID=A0AAV6K607_9ERIC|nr:hypothetical protein RHGRI_013456 [Rhododendron griersonianum]
MKLRRAGAIILGKASLSECMDFRSLTAPEGWSARGGQGKRYCTDNVVQNPYVLPASPCDSSSGSAISVAANMVAVLCGYSPTLEIFFGLFRPTNIANNRY